MGDLCTWLALPESCPMMVFIDGKKQSILQPPSPLVLNPIGLIPLWDHISLSDLKQRSLTSGQDPKNSRTRLGNRKGLQVCCSKTAVSLILHSQVFLKLSAVSKAICERRWGVSCLADTNLKKNLQHKPFVPVWLCWYSNCNMYPSGLVLTC